MAENLNTLYYALGLDDHEMQEGLKKAIQNLSVLDDEFNRINKAIEDTFGKKIKNAPIHNEIKGLKGELQALEKQWNALTLAERRGTEGQRIRAEYESLRKEAGNLNNSLARLYSESQKAASGQKGLAAQFGLVNKELTLQSRLMSNINTLFTTYISIFAVKSFIQSLARVRGEFENQQIALRAILRDAEAADRIFRQIKSFAVVSPFEFKDLVGYAKQLSAFQVPVNELFETTKRLADVSAGLGVGMDRIILAYGQVRSAAVLRGQELRQFTEAGIPLVDELAKKFSELEGRVVSAGDVFEKISNRMVSFGMVKEIFEDMTNEGGMFYMMQEKQAESLKGKIANLADAYDIMLNNIGEANDGILKGGVEGIAALFSNWEKVWKILKTIIATYGTYKAVLISVAAIEKLTASTATISRFLQLASALSNTSKSAVIAAGAMKALNLTFLTTPVGLVATAVAAVVGSLILFRQEAQSTSDIINGLNESVTELAGHGKDTEKLINSYEELANKSNRSQEENERLNKIINQIAATVPNATKAINDYNGVLSLNIDKVREYSEEEKKSLQKGLQAQIDVAAKRREELIKERDFMQRQIAEGAKIQEFYTLRGKIETKDEINTEEIAQYNQKVLQLYTDIDNLNNSIRDSQNAISGLFAQPKAPDDFSASIKELNKQISDLKGFDPNILEGAKIKDTSKVIKDATQDIVTLFKTYEEEKERISKAPSLYSKEDIDNSNTMYSLYKKIKEEILGIKDDENKKGSTKDPNAERLKEQIDLIKKAQAQYEKYLQIMSPNEALNAIRTDQQFMALDVQFEPDKVRERLQMVMNDIGKLPQSPELEKLKKSIQAAFTDIDYNDAKKNFDRFLNDLTKELDSYKDKYNFYEQLLGITGDQNLAVNLAFNGDFEKAGKGIIEQIQQGMVEAASDTGLTLEQIMNLDFTKSAQDLGISEKLKEFLQKSVGEIGKIQVGNILDFQKLIAEYSSVEDKISTIQANGAAERAKISETYARQRIDADEETYVALEEQELDALNASKKREDEAVRELMSEMLQLTPFWQKLFGDLDEIGYQSLTKLSDKAKEVVDSAKVKKDKDGKVEGYTVEYDKKSYDISVELFEKLRKQSNSLDKDLKASNPFKTLFDTLKEGPQADEDFFDFATKISGSLNGIIGIASDVGASLSEMFSAIGNDKAAEAIDFSFQLADALGGMLTDLASGNPVQMVAGMVKGVAKIVTLFSQKHDNKLEKQIKNSEKEVRRLQNAYSDLERAIDKSLGTDKYAYTSDQVKNLQQQQAEIALQAQAERDKKKTDKDKVADLERQYVELGQQIQDVLDNIRDEVIGSTADEIAQELGNAFFEAFAAGEDYAEAWGSKVKDIVGDIVKRMLIDKLLDKQIGEAIDKYSKQWMDQEGNINTDKVIETSEGFYNELMGIGDGFQAAIEALTKDPFFMELLGPGEKEGEGLSKGIKGITEDTAQLLASYLNAIRGSVLLQELYMKNIDTNVAGMYQAMGGSPNITTTTTIPPEIIVAISEPFKLNNSLLASIDANMANVHSISANALAQLVMIQSNTYNTAMATRDAVEELRGVISPGHPKGGNGIKVWA